MTDRVPFNVEAEQALIGSVLMDPRVYPRVSRIVGTGDFYEQIHRLIWEQIEAAVAAGRTISPITLMSYLPKDEIAPGLSMQGYIAKLLTFLTTTAHVEEYARSVHDLATRRLVISISHGLVAEAVDGGLDVNPKDMVQRAIADLHEVTRDQETAQGHGLAHYSRQVIDIISARLKGVDELVPSTGLEDLDQCLGGGYRAGRMFIFAARPGAGKTVLLCSSARKCAAAGSGVKIYSLEIDGRENYARIISDHLASHRSARGRPIEYQRIMNGWLNPHEAELVAEMSREVDQLPIRIDDSSGLTMADIEVRTRIDMERMQREGTPLKVVMIDYIQLVRAAKTYQGNRVEELGNVALAGKEMAKRLGIAVVFFCQLNRGVESRDDKRPQINDLRGSGELEEHADAIGLLYREAYYIEKSPEYQRGEEGALSVYLSKQNDLEISMAKNRLGPSRTVNAFVDVKFSMVRAGAML